MHDIACVGSNVSIVDFYFTLVFSDECIEYQMDSSASALCILWYLIMLVIFICTIVIMYNVIVGYITEFKTFIFLYCTYIYYVCVYVCRVYICHNHGVVRLLYFRSSLSSLLSVTFCSMFVSFHLVYSS